MRFPEVLLSPEDEHLRSRITSISITGHVRCGKQWIHHFILPSKGVKNPVDHIDHNPRNNRRENLRYLTLQQNLARSQSRLNNSSGIVGVSYNKSRAKWEAYYSSYGGGKTRLYYGPDFFLACCARKSFEVKHHA